MSPLKQGVVVVLALLLPLSLTLGSESQKETKRGWLGVSISDVTKRIAKDENLKSRDGAYVSDVEEKSPAEAAGIQEGDVIVEFAGRALFDADDLAKAVGRTEPGTKVAVVVMRKGDKKTLSATVGEAPARSRARKFSVRVAPPIISVLAMSDIWGMKLMDLNPQLAAYFGVKGDGGVLVTEVKDESPAAKGGVKAGDIILTVGKKSVEEVDDVRRALDKYEEGEKVDLSVSRKGETKTLNLTAEDTDEDFEIPALPHMRMHRDWGWEPDDTSFDLQWEISDPDLAPAREILFRIQKDVLERNQESLKGLQERLKTVYESPQTI